MYRSALKLLKLINDLLDLSRLEESRLRLDVKEHDLVALPARRWSSRPRCWRSRKRHRAHLRGRDRGPVTVWCDLERLERVFVNLLSNAIKFTPTNGHVDGVASATSSTTSRWSSRTTGRASRRSRPSSSSSASTRWTWRIDAPARRRRHRPRAGARAGDAARRHHPRRERRQHGRPLHRHAPEGTRPLPPEALAARAGRRRLRAAASPAWTGRCSSARAHEFRLLDIEEATERRVVERDTDEEARPYTARGGRGQPAGRCRSSTCRCGASSRC